MLWEIRGLYIRSLLSGRALCEKFCKWTCVGSMCMEMIQDPVGARRLYMHLRRSERIKDLEWNSTVNSKTDDGLFRKTQMLRLLVFRLVINRCCRKDKPGMHRYLVETRFLVFQYEI